MTPYRRKEQAFFKPTTAPLGVPRTRLSQGRASWEEGVGGAGAERAEGVEDETFVVETGEVDCADGSEDVADHGEGFVSADGAFARILFEELENEQASVTRKRGNDLAGMDGRMGVELADIHQIFPEIPFVVLFETTYTRGTVDSRRGQRTGKHERSFGTLEKSATFVFMARLLKSVKQFVVWD
ncbi:hypothetical protein L6R29_11185 [Myxococcota bacterium]|nr:hypothetical protein [Myxococcota bacterium]